ncbi:hypothetical protein R1flu_025615 [Riccia fluitans]|uniref:NAD(P)H-quinone oxidoreductase subunit L, chloroplastic n=1 Tax=Riccia fluitans TaxID=41844 RepID=A0ABD1XZ58_9MARC
MAALLTVAPRGLGNFALGSAVNFKRARSSLVTVKCSGIRSSLDTFQIAQDASEQLKTGAQRLVEKAKDSQVGQVLAPIAASAAFYMQVAGPALAEISESAAPTEVVDDDFWFYALLTSGVAGILYLLVIPLIVYNYLRLRWYKRNALETYFQFMLVFIFFPGMLLWAPFINFRRLPKEGTEAP